MRRSLGFLALSLAGATAGLFLAFAANGNRNDQVNAEHAAVAVQLESSRKIYHAQATELLQRYRSASDPEVAAAGQGLHATLLEWLNADPHGGIEFLNRHQLCGLLGRDDLQGIFAAWDKISPLQAVRVAMLVEELGWRDTWYRLAFDRLATGHPQAAFDVLQTTPAHLQEEATKSLITEWVQKDGEAALRAFSASKSANRKAVLRQVFRAWTDVDPEAAWAHLTSPASVSSEDYREKVGAFTNASGSKTKPAELYLKRLEANPTDERALASLQSYAREWIRQDARAALAWAEKCPNEWLRYSLLAEVGNRLAHEEPSQAIALADRLPADPARQEIYLTVAASLGQKDPTEGFRWAAAIESRALRGVAMKRVLNNALEWQKAKAGPVLFAEDALPRWVPTLILALENRIEPADSMGWRWSLGAKEIDKVRKAIAGHAPAGQRARMESTLARYEAKLAAENAEAKP